MHLLLMHLSHNETHSLSTNASELAALASRHHIICAIAELSRFQAKQG